MSLVNNKRLTVALSCTVLGLVALAGLVANELATGGRRCYRNDSSFPSILIDESDALYVGLPSARHMWIRRRILLLDPARYDMHSLEFFEVISEFVACYLQGGFTPEDDTVAQYYGLNPDEPGRPGTAT